jgi:hypothetical protein
MMNILIIALLAAGVLAPQSNTVTFSEHIAPIVYNNCVTCHRPGEAAPFSLISYDDVKRRGALVATVTQKRYMPPWHAAHGYGEFTDERRLTDSQIAAIAEWVKQGMPEGDRSKMPQLPQFADGWHLGKPDLILEMPAGFELPASGPDLFRNFTIPMNLPEDKWVRAVEFRPSARKAAHHALFAYVSAGSTSRFEGVDGKPGFGGMGNVGVTPGQANSGGLGGWAVGGTPVFLPEGLAASLPKGSDFLLQMHFHPTGKPEVEKAVIGIHFGDKPPERRMMAVGLPAVFGIGAGLDIPPDEKNYTIQDSFTLPVDVKAYSAVAHAHYLGKEMKATATLPDGSTKPLIWIQDWDFNWQEAYLYKEPFVLPKGTRIDATIRYDNSVDNPRNPNNPPKRAQFGEESFDEMGTVGLMVTALRKEDEAELQKALAGQAQAAIQKGGADGTVKRFLQRQLLRRPAPPAPRTRLTLFDRQGKVVSTVGEPGVYSQPAISPDGNRVAVIRTDQAMSDVWVIDIATGQETRITSDPLANSSPVWSSDGKQLAYVSMFPVENYSAIYRRAADGSGSEELIYKHTSGTAAVITDWSAAGVLCFWAGDAMYALPVNGDRKPIGLVNDKIAARGGRFSPDGRFIAYSSNESGRFELYVAELKLPSPIAKPLQISKDGALGGIFWRQDAKELYFMAFPGFAEMVVDVTAGAEFQAGAPRLLFRPQGVTSPAQLSNIASRDAERFIFLPQVPAGAVGR